MEGLRVVSCVNGMKGHTMFRLSKLFLVLTCLTTFGMFAAGAGRPFRDYLNPAEDARYYDLPQRQALPVAYTVQPLQALPEGVSDAGLNVFRNVLLQYKSDNPSSVMQLHHFEIPPEVQTKIINNLGYVKEQSNKQLAGFVGGRASTFSADGKILVIDDRGKEGSGGKILVTDDRGKEGFGVFIRFYRNIDGDFIEQKHRAFNIDFAIKNLAVNRHLISGTGHQNIDINHFDSFCTAMAVTLDGNTIFTGHCDSSNNAYGGLIIRWERGRGDYLPQQIIHTYYVGALAVSPDGKLLFSAHVNRNNKFINCWQKDRFQNFNILNSVQTARCIKDLAVRAHDNYGVYSSDTGENICYRAVSHNRLSDNATVLIHQSTTVDAVAVSSDGQQILTGDDRIIRRYCKNALGLFELVETLYTGYTEKGIYTLSFSSNSPSLYALSLPHEILCWRSQRHQLLEINKPDALEKEKEMATTKAAAHVKASRHAKQKLKSSRAQHIGFLAKHSISLLQGVIGLGFLGLLLNATIDAYKKSKKVDEQSD